MTAAFRDAACRGSDPDLFFPEYPRFEPAAAKVAFETLCRACPARQECFDYAMANKTSGVWAGTTTEQRDLARRRAASRRRAEARRAAEARRQEELAS